MVTAMIKRSALVRQMIGGLRRFVGNDGGTMLVAYTIATLLLRLLSNMMLTRLLDPIAFGILTAALNYIPYIGAAVVVAILFVVGLVVSSTIGGALLAPALFVAIATVEGQIITPSIVGHRLTMSPFAVFLSLAFWAWLWGPLGAFLAAPLLIVGMVILNHLFELKVYLVKI